MAENVTNQGQFRQQVEYPPEAPQEYQERQTEAPAPIAVQTDRQTEQGLQRQIDGHTPLPDALDAAEPRPENVQPQAQTYQKIGQDLEEVKADSVKAGDVLTLGSGVKVRVKKVPPGLLQKLYAKRGGDEPLPPMEENTDEATGRTYKVANPDDPQYKRALMQHNLDLGMTVKDLVLGIGLEIVEVPENVPGLDSPDWHERIEILGEDVPEGGIARRVAWFDAVAIDSQADYETIQAISAESMSVDQEEVKEAQESFQGND